MRLPFALAAVLVSGSLDNASAQTTNSWNRNASALWQTATNWAPANVPNAAGSVAVFGPSPTLLSNNCIVGTAFTAGRTITNSAITTLGGIVFGTNANNIAINNDLGQLTFDGPDATTFITIDPGNTAANNQINGAAGTIQIVDRLRIDHLGSGSLTIQGPISSVGGGAGLTVAGTGQVILSAGAAGITASSFIGSVDLEGGTLRVDGDGALGNTGNAVNFTNNAVFFARTNFFVNAGRVFNFAGDGTIRVTNLNNGLRFGNTAGRVTGPGKLTKVGLGSFILSGANAGFTGPVDLQEGTIVMTNSTALGTNAITIGSNTKFDVINGAAQNAVFNVASGGLIGGQTPFLSSLTRGGNLNISSNGIIFQRGATNGNILVNNLGTGSDLYFGLGGSISNNFTVSDAPGTTPWKGISTDGTSRALTNSVITAAGNFYLQAINVADADSILTLGNNINVPGTVSIIGSTTVTGYVATVPGAISEVRLFENNHDFSNVKFEVQSNTVLALRTGTALGGSGANNAATKATVEVLAGGELAVDAVTNTVDSINSDVTIRAGGILSIAALNSSSNRAGLSGTGTITLDPGAVVSLNNSEALNGSQFGPGNIASNHIVRLGAIDIVNISSVNPAATFMLNATVGFTNETLTLDGGLLTVGEGATRTFNPGQGIDIGANGATFGGVLQNGATIRELIILCPVTSTGGGPLIIGTTNVLAFDGEPRNGRVRFGNANSTAASVFPGTDLRWETGELRFSGKGNTDAFVAGTLLTNIVIPPNGGQFLIDLTGTNETLVSSQRIVLNQALRTNSLRNIWVATNTLSTNITLICTNLIAPNNSVLSVDEGGGVNFVAGVTLEGSEFRVTDGPLSDRIDFVFLLNPSGLPSSVIVGSAIDGADQTLTNFISDRIGDNITFEQFRNLLILSNSLTLGTNITVNSLGTNYTHPIHGQYIDGGVNIHIGRDGSNSGSTSNLTINLGSGQDLTVFVDEVTNTPPTPPITNTFFGRVNILTNQTGQLLAGLGDNSDLVGTAVFNDVHAYNGSTIQMTAVTETNLIGNLTLEDGPVSIFASTATQFRQLVRNVTMNGNTLTITGTNRIQLLGTASGGGSILVTNTIITNTTVVNASCLLVTNVTFITNGARFGGNGTISGSLAIAERARLEAGRDTIGLLTVNGALTFASGSSNLVGIASNIAGAFGQINAGGAASLNGDLTLDFVGGYYPATSNDVLTILTAGSRSGTFANAPDGGRVSIIEGGTNVGSYRVTYTGTQVQLGNWQYSTNDADGDSITDSWALRYFGVISLAAGTAANQRDGDSDGDGVSNIGEFLAGTDPLNPNSVFKIVSVVSGPGTSATVQWVNNDNPMHHTSVHTVQYTDVLGTPYTNVVGTTITTPAAGIAQWVDDGTLTGGVAPLSLPAGKRHYRIQAE